MGNAMEIHFLYLDIRRSATAPTFRDHPEQ